MTSLRTVLLALIGAGAVATSLVMGAGLLAERNINHETERALVAKDVTADILPPPLYLVELRLVLSQLMDGSLDADQADRERQRLVAEYQARVAHWTQSPPYGLEAQLLGAQHAAGQRFIAATDTVVAAARSGDSAALASAVKQAHALYLTHREGVDATVKAATAFADQALDNVAVAQRHALLIDAAVFLGALVALGGLGLWARRSVWQATGGEPADVARIANAVAEGDLTVQVVVAPGDQHSVMAAMQRMCRGLEQLVGTVRGSSEQIALGSREIASGNADLSVRTEQQSASLQQTASAMDEFSGTVQTTAETASQATRLAHAASDAATRGAGVVRDVVSTMEDITASSRKIADITSVIDGIAFQTNILALNAAVEAARAGEQGRGFAVVASEVRSLAQRSATAAKEISELIARSVEKVDDGARLVADAGSTMDDIVGQVQRVSDLIGEISAAATEQTQGIGLVSRSVNELDGSTQQNAALVEQSAAAADNLSQQAAELVRVVGRFRTEPA